jgi:hypothetical protein
LARPKGNKIRLSIELDTKVNLQKAKEDLVEMVTNTFSTDCLISLRADVSEVVVEPDKEEKE